MNDDKQPEKWELPAEWRPVSYLSYSAMTLWERDPDEYAKRRLTEAPPWVQEKPAAVGSAFDARVKAALSAEIFGVDEDAIYARLFEEQVDAENRDFAGPAGSDVFDGYRACGAFGSLLGQLRDAWAWSIRFDHEPRGTVAGVPFYGRPDAAWLPRRGPAVIHDWKVNGYLAASKRSPTKGYRVVWPAGNAHKDFRPVNAGGYVIGGTPLEQLSTEWADQLCLYQWALGEPVGTEAVCSVHQVVTQLGGEPRVAEFKARVSRDHQQALTYRLQRAWSYLSVGHVFPFLSAEESAGRCSLLVKQRPAGGLMDEVSKRPFWM